MSDAVMQKQVRSRISLESLVPWTVIGTLLQLAMILGGHFDEFIRNNVFAIGGMLISMFAGAMWARMHARGKRAASLGGSLVGGGCALVGIAVSVVLGDTEAMILAIGTVSSMVTGAIGGVILYAVAGVHRS